MNALLSTHQPRFQARVSRTGRRASCVVVRAEKEAAPLNVIEAREWIASWKFGQAKVSSLGDSISKAAVLLEDTKRAKQAHLAALDVSKSKRVPVNFHIKQKLQYGQSLKLVGAAPEFGSWTPDQAPLLDWSDGDVWTVTLKLPIGSHEFKVVGAWSNGEVQWESGDNRFVEVPMGAESDIEVKFDGRLSASKS